MSRHELPASCWKGRLDTWFDGIRSPSSTRLQRTWTELLKKLPRHDLRVTGVEYSLYVLHDENDWGALGTIWDELLLATPEHTVFQSYAYQRLWWRHFGSDNELFIVLIVRDDVIRASRRYRSSR